VRCFTNIYLPHAEVKNWTPKNQKMMWTLRLVYQEPISMRKSLIFKHQDFVRYIHSVIFSNRFSKEHVLFNFRNNSFYVKSPRRLNLSCFVRWWLLIPFGDWDHMNIRIFHQIKLYGHNILLLRGYYLKWKHGYDQKSTSTSLGYL